MGGGYGRRTIALVVACDTRAGSSGTGGGGGGGGGGGSGVITPLIDCDNRSVTQTQGYFFSLSPVILWSSKVLQYKNLNHAHMWVWLIAPPLFENPGFCPGLDLCCV